MQPNDLEMIHALNTYQHRKHRATPNCSWKEVKGS